MQSDTLTGDEFCLGAGEPATMFALKSRTARTVSVSPKTNSRKYSMSTIRGPSARSGAASGWALRSGVKRLGEILDHKVEVRSIPGKGTRFFIMVPRGRSGVKVAEANPPVHPHHDAFLGSVLAIEDEASVRAALGDC